MRQCPECNLDLPLESAQFCPKCGHKLQSDKMNEESTSDDDKLEFEVTETVDDDRELVGAVEPTETETVDIGDDDLGVVTPGELADQGEFNAQLPPEQISTDDSSPEEAEPESTPVEAEPLETRDMKQEFSGDPQELLKEIRANDPDGIERLSDKEIEAINRDLYAQPEPTLTDEDKDELKAKLQGLAADAAPAPFGNTPIDPKKHRADAGDPPPQPQPPTPDTPEPAADLPRPTMARHGRGIAYFYKGFIKLVGSQALHTDDELVVGDRTYVLKEKTLSRNAKIGALAGALVCILAIVGMALVGGSGTGEGRIMGIVLDDFERPYVQTATIRFPELGKEVQSNAQGFFATDDLPVGPQQMEYIVDGEVVKVDYATVIGGETIMVSLIPEFVEEFEPVQETVEEPVKEAPKPKPQASKPKPKQNRRTASRPKNGKIELAANIDGARLTIDGEVLGAGNLTYGDIKPGDRQYEVAADGYVTDAGTLKVEPGKKAVLAVNLEPEITEEERLAAQAEDFFYTGMNALQVGDHSAAVKDFSLAIDAFPSFSDAHFHRAEAYQELDMKEQAYRDYTRAGQLYHDEGEYQTSLIAYTAAIDVDDDIATAFMGRAVLYQERGDYLSAIEDYDEARKKDKDNPEPLFRIGECYYQIDEMKDASKYFDKARKKDESNPLTYQYLLLCYLAREKEDDVRKTYDRFKENASPQALQELRRDSRFAAIWQIVED